MTLTKPGEKPIRLFDGGGLYLEIALAGGKWWRLKYRFAGKENRLSLGVYPAVSLKDARERRDGYRRLLAGEVDPSEHRKTMKSVRADRAANSFEALGCEWFSKFIRVAPTYVCALLAEKFYRREGRPVP